MFIDLLVNTLLLNFKINLNYITLKSCMCAHVHTHARARAHIRHNIYTVKSSTNVTNKNMYNIYKYMLYWTSYNNIHNMPTNK